MICEERRKILAQVHIMAKSASICNDCGAVVFLHYCPVCGSVSLRDMLEIDYRRVLKDVTGKISCTEMADWEIRKVIRLFYRYGYKPEKSIKKRSEESREKMIYKIKKTAPEKLGNNWFKRLSGYCKKLFKKDIDELNFNQLRSVWGFLRKV
jgi:ferredoxin-like protein FixX